MIKFIGIFELPKLQFRNRHSNEPNLLHSIRRFKGWSVLMFGKWNKNSVKNKIKTFALDER